MTITFVLDPSFVLAEQIPLVVEDLRYGLEHFFVKEQAVIDLAVDRVVRGTSDPVLHELAELQGEDIERVPEVLDALDDPERIHDPRESARKWLYLQLKAAYCQRGQLSDPLGVVEQIYADFDYPPTVGPLVRYMPLKPSDEPGPDALIQRWARFLDDEHRALTSP